MGSPTYTGIPVLAALLAPGVAAAQQAPTRVFSISPQLRFENDDNILRLPDYLATPVGRHRSDYRTSPQVAIDIVRPIGRQQVFLNGLVGYDFYRYNKRLERERINLTGGGSASAGGCTANTQLSYVRRQSDLADIVIGGPTLGISRAGNRETLITPSVGVNCGTAGGISSGLSYSHEDVENSDPFRSFADYHSSTYTARIGLNRPALGDVGLYSNYRRGIYDNRILTNGTNEVVESYAAGVSVDRQFGRIKGHVSGGITRVKSNTPGVRPFRGGTYDVQLTYIAPRGTATLGLARSIQQSNLLGVSYSVTDDYNAGLTYRLNSRVDLAAGASVTRRRLSQSPLTPVSFGNFNDRTRTINMRASYTVGRHVSLDADATWRRRRGELPIFDYNARILALTLRLH